MNLIAKRIRGMQDLLPGESEKWEWVEKVMRDEASLCGFRSLRTPVLESTELFERSVGDASDVVEKEMYTFEDKGNRSVTLRPEGTAGALRAVLENGLYSCALPLKLMYVSSCYRYEKPQSGRYREFFQFGLEVFGSASALADSELICVAHDIIERLGIKGVSLQINSIGCQKCRKKYAVAMKEYFDSKKDKLCATCQDRLGRNPMRIFDCKGAECAKVCDGAPVVTDYLCPECEEHFSELKSLLEVRSIEYSVNPRVVRGLDYYSRTVFEFVCDIGGSEITICGGGRYDGLSEILGGTNLPAIGLGMGIERILAIMENQGISFMEPKAPQVYIASMGQAAQRKAINLCRTLRSSSVAAQTDIVSRNLKPQMKFADKIGVVYTLVIGEEELTLNRAKLKEMSSGKEFEISIGENFMKDFLDVQFEKYRQL